VSRLSDRPTATAGDERPDGADRAFREATRSMRRDPDLGSDDPYAVLGVRSNASWQEIVAAHRSLARRFHPDKVATLDQVARMAAEQIMFKINGAYRELKVRRGR
jgi:DnaJ-class molecular chaperone